MELALELSIAATQLFRNGDYRGAAALLKKAVTHKPDLFEAHHLLGMTYGCLDEFDHAIAHLHEAVRLSPSSASAHLLLGKAYDRLKLHQDAIPSLRTALELEPDSLSSGCALANALVSAGHAAEGMSILNHFAERSAADPLWHFTMGTLCQVESPHAALQHYREALRLKPDYHEVGFNYAILLLSLGMFEAGWREYEHRIPRLNLNPELALIPRWHGEPLTGKTILVVTEQGFGDTIQFIRYAGLLKAQGAMVYVLCPNNLPVRPLMGWAAGVDGTIASHEPVPYLDWYVPLMSLPGLFGTTLESIPSPPGYITPNADEVIRWRKRLDPYKGFKVGLVWAGNRTPGAIENRSVSFQEFSAVLDIEGITFFSLQIGPDALAGNEAGVNGTSLIDLTAHIHDFGDTAALIANLDLVVSVDTATAHLAGALGKPVWILIGHPPDWRWMRDRPDSPWYPSVRLFRQHQPGEWGPPIAELAEALRREYPLSKRPCFNTEEDFLTTGISSVSPSSTSVMKFRDLIGTVTGTKFGIALQDRDGNPVADITDLFLNLPRHKLKHSYFYQLSSPKNKLESHSFWGPHLVNAAEFIRDYHDCAALIANLDCVITFNQEIANIAVAMNKMVWLLVPDNEDDVRMAALFERRYRNVTVFRRHPGESWRDVFLKVSLHRLLLPTEHDCDFSDNEQRIDRDIRTMSSAIEIHSTDDLIALADAPTPSFVNVVIETTTVCNLRCSYCPNSTVGRPAAFMDERVFTRIIDSLAEYDSAYSGRISPHFYGEPLVDTRLEKFVRYTRQRLPTAQIELFTNGELLTVARYLALKEAGVTSFIVSQHSPEPSPIVMATLEAIHTNYPHLYSVTYVDQFHSTEKMNRGGIIKTAGSGKLSIRCNLYKELTFDVHGNAVLCCNDYLSSQSFGNISTQSIREIWDGPAYRRARNLLGYSYFPFPICTKCTMF